mgnify:FL=1
MRDSKAILKKKKKTTKSNSLYSGIDYTVTNYKNRIAVEWSFGRAQEYWEFVDQGVRGSGGFKGSGKARGQGSPFRFKKKNIAEGVVAGWITNKPLRLRNSAGKFVSKTQKNINSAAFLIGRAIAQRGLSRSLFFTKPYEKETKKYEKKILQAVADDLENELEKLIKD